MGIEMRNSSNSRSYHCMTKTTHLSDEPFFMTFTHTSHVFRNGNAQNRMFCTRLVPICSKCLKFQHKTNSQGIPVSMKSPLSRGKVVSYVLKNIHPCFSQRRRG